MLINTHKQCIICDVSSPAANSRS